jgi:hypothetical protein
MVSVSFGKSQILPCWMVMISMILISLPSMWDNQNTTSITSHLPQKSEISSLVPTSISHTKIVLYRISKENQAKDGKQKLQIKTNLSAFKLQIHLSHSMPFKFKLLKETTLPNSTLNTQSKETILSQSKIHTKSLQLLKRIWQPSTSLESMPLPLELESVASKDG